jgi:urea transport system permease protein
MGIVPSIEFVLLVAVGGRGTLSGAVIGAIVVSWARSSLSESFPDTWQYFYGALFIGAVVLFPAGLVGFVRKVRSDGLRSVQINMSWLPGRAASASTGTDSSIAAEPRGLSGVE